MESHGDRYIVTEHLVGRRESVLDGAKPVVTPVWCLGKGHWREAHELPLGQVVALCRRIIGDIDPGAGRRGLKLDRMRGNTLGQLVQQFRIGCDAFRVAIEAQRLECAVLLQ